MKGYNHRPWMVREFIEVQSLQWRIVPVRLTLLKGHFDTQVDGGDADTRQENISALDILRDERSHLGGPWRGWGVEGRPGGM
jgi:hypothetical protein